MPIITLEVMQDSLSDTVLDESFYNETKTNTIDTETKEAGVHFLTQKTGESNNLDSDRKDDDNSDSLRIKNDLLEYTTRGDGSVTCKLCGKVLASRPHWYRHKYRAHVMRTTSPSPASLFQCEQCLIYFKSRKGYIGHIASRHSETLEDVSPVLTNAQAEALKDQENPAATTEETEIKKEPDPEMCIPKAIVPKYKAPVAKQNATKNSEVPVKRALRYREPRNDKNWKEKRSREEKLVADIIARVRRECEAQGSRPARRGYSRKSEMRT